MSRRTPNYTPPNPPLGVWETNRDDARMNLDGMLLFVHHYIGCGEAWFWSCNPFASASQLVDAGSLDQAKAMALGRLREKLESNLALIQKVTRA